MLGATARVFVDADYLALFVGISVVVRQLVYMTSAKSHCIENVAEGKY